VTRASEGRFERVTVAGPRAGPGTATIDGGGRAGVGPLPRADHGLPAGREGVHRGAR